MYCSKASFVVILASYSVSFDRNATSADRLRQVSLGSSRNAYLDSLCMRERTGRLVAEWHRRLSY